MKVAIAADGGSFTLGGRHGSYLNEVIATGKEGI